MPTHKKYLRKGMLRVEILITNDQLEYLQGRAASAGHRSVSRVIRDSLQVAIQRTGLARQASTPKEPHYEPFNVA